jgi:hypothetical protein
VPLGLLAAVSGHPREIHARHRARSLHTLCSFVAQLLRIDGGGPGGVHGIGNGSEVTRVQMGIGRRKMAGSWPREAAAAVTGTPLWASRLAAV